jgi:hypothetical protein
MCGCDIRGLRNDRVIRSNRLFQVASSCARALTTGDVVRVVRQRLFDLATV